MSGRSDVTYDRRGRPIAVRSSRPIAPPVDPESFRGRLREAFPLLVVALAFLLGALVASALHARLFSSEYPLWILLGLNGGLAAIAGAASFFVREDVSDEDPDLMLVPRAAWEELVRERAPPRPAPPEPGGRPRWDESVEERAPPPAPRRKPSPQPSLLASVPAMISRTRPVSSGTSPPGEEVAPPRTSPEMLRLEVGLLELQGFAETAVATGENVGPDELERLLASTSDAITRLGATLGLPTREHEPTGPHLLRLLRDTAALPKAEIGAKRSAALADLADRLDQLLVGAPAVPPPEELGSPVAEFNQLLEELQRRQTTPARRPPPSSGDPKESREP
jgi:hypothetical protein